MIEPVNRKLKLDIKEIYVHGLTEGKIEGKGIILDVAETCTIWGKENIGRTLHFMPYAVFINTIGDDKHYYISEDSDAILGIE